MPSIRQLAREAGVSVITTRLYRDLEAEGFIASRQGKGSIVLSRQNKVLKDQYLSRIKENIRVAVQDARCAGITEEKLLEIFKNNIREG